MPGENDGLVEALKAQIVTLNAEAGKRRHAMKAAAAQLAAITSERDAAVAARDGLQVKLDAKPGELQAKIDQLEAGIRERDHRDGFRNALTGEIKATARDKDGKDVETVYQLKPGVSVETFLHNLKYTADGPTPDAPTIQGLVTKSVASHPFLFEPKPVAADAAPNGSGGPTHTIVTGRGSAPGTAVKGVNDTTAPTAAASIGASSGSARPGRLA
jgi:hypothetical protein